MGNKASSLQPKAMQDLRSKADVDFTEDEIRDWFKTFKQFCKKGRSSIDQWEFVRIYNSLFHGDGSKFASNVFRTFDKNNDGVVDFEEYIVGLCVSGSSSFRTKMRWAFHMYDENNDGMISRKEMKNIIQAVYDMIYLPGAEVSPSANELTCTVFESMDTDKDNMISWPEFSEGINSHIALIKLLQIDPSSAGS
ncbi:hypothetical protein ScPMuIL_006346 [Solemya velum]